MNDPRDALDRSPAPLRRERQERERQLGDIGVSPFSLFLQTAADDGFETDRDLGSDVTKGGGGLGGDAENEFREAVGEEGGLARE